MRWPAKGYSSILTIILIIIKISKLLKYHSKAKHRAPAHSRTLRRVREVVYVVVWRGSESGFQKVRGGKVAVKVGVVYILSDVWCPNCFSCNLILASALKAQTTRHFLKSAKRSFITALRPLIHDISTSSFQASTLLERLEHGLQMLWTLTCNW